MELLGNASVNVKRGIILLPFLSMAWVCGAVEAFAAGEDARCDGLRPDAHQTPQDGSGATITSRLVEKRGEERSACTSGLPGAFLYLRLSIPALLSPGLQREKVSYGARSPPLHRLQPGEDT
jgi:hypothetical protein